MLKPKIDKARKMVGLWSGTVARLQALSAETGYSQVELVDMAIEALVEQVRADAVQEKTHAES